MSLDAARQCSKCHRRANFIQEHFDHKVEKDEIKFIQCPEEGRHCDQKPWFYCCPCNKKMKHSTLKHHLETSSHKSATAAQRMSTLLHDNTAEKRPWAETQEAETQEAELDLDLRVAGTSMAPEPTPHSANPRPQLTPIGGQQPNRETHTKPAPFCRINMAGHEWLAKLHKETPLASFAELNQLLPKSDCRFAKMNNYFTAELASHNGENGKARCHEGFCGGGLMYLVAAAFQQVDAAKLDPRRLPSLQEALWHLHNMIQYHSMTEKQRSRQSRLNRPFAHADTFPQTHIPDVKQLSKFYGSNGQHSMWNNLPSPHVEGVDGAAYTRRKSSFICLLPKNPLKAI